MNFWACKVEWMHENLYFEIVMMRSYSDMTEDERLYWLASQDFQRSVANMKEEKMFTWRELKRDVDRLTEKELDTEVLIANPSRKLHHALYSSNIKTDKSDLPEGTIYISVGAKKCKYWYRFSGPKSKQLIYLCRGTKDIDEYMKLVRNDSVVDVAYDACWYLESDEWRKWDTLAMRLELEKDLEEISAKRADAILGLNGTTKKFELTIE